MTTLTRLDLTWCLIPVALVLGINLWWQQNLTETLVAVIRMVSQLVVVGYALIIVFAQPSPWTSTLIISLMLVIAAWIAIRPVSSHLNLLRPAIFAIGLSVSLHLCLTIFFILRPQSWYQPELLIPLAGMYLANTMNTLSLAAERYCAERRRHVSVSDAQKIGFQAAMIPQVNSLLAVGLVALPGVMTGQILSGVSPLIAVRYQIMVMSMIFGAAGLGSMIMLRLLGKQEIDNSGQPSPG